MVVLSAVEHSLLLLLLLLLLEVGGRCCCCPVKTLLVPSMWSDATRDVDPFLQ